MGYFEKKPETPWDRLPDFELYMDQVLSFMQKQKLSGELTAAMVNNYTKAGILPRCKGKRYGREHLACLSVICLLKQVLSMGEIKRFFEEKPQEPIRDFYNRFAEMMEGVGGENAVLEKSALQGADRVLHLAMKSAYDQAACREALNALSQAKEEEK